FLVDDLSKIVASMRVGANRIREIVLSLRNFSRLDEAECKVVDIHEGIENTLLILRHRLKAGASRRNIEIVKDYGDLPKIECYPGQLNQVFMNLITNAIDALEEVEVEQHVQKSITPGVISIQTSLLSDRDCISIKISDNGSGIPEDVRSKLFDPFFTTKPIGKGTGLGLSISYQIVTEKHRGRLLCDSEWRKGTTFTVEIPIQQSSMHDEVILSLP
ncbi:HAMP domain-containing histidine kinase, partial [bacterium]|nr:HAMP domain-containing histidine kinase [bacterium]